MLKNKMKGLFFWSKNKPAKKLQVEELIKLAIEYMPKIKEAVRATQTIEGDGKIIGRMYDYFKNYDGSFPDGLGEWGEGPNPDGIAMKDDRIVATPLSVMTELETVPTPFNSNDEELDEKIATLTDKTKLLNQRFAKDQLEGLIQRLENRKKYREHIQFFGGFPNTTDQKIDALLSKYKVVIKTSDLFIPTFPKEAIEVMKKYTEVTKALCGEAPVFYVIAEEKDFAKKYEKLDPILLAQSPFGFYWQILGAWDKEMLLLSEL